MERSTTQRRLVKSPPELWAELSNETALRRHLAEFGDIRITRADPETTVAWEGDRASGTVELAPAGWGTKVVLTVTPMAPQGAPEPVGPEPELAAEPEPAPVAAESLAAESEPVAPEPDQVAPRPRAHPPVRRGLIARLLLRLARAVVGAGARAEIPAPGPPVHDPSPPTPAPDPTPPDPGPAPTPPPVPDPVPPEPTPDPTPPPSIDVPVPPPAAAELDPERTVAILTQMLDDLGADHRRIARV